MLVWVVLGACFGAAAVVVDVPSHARRNEFLLRSLEKDRSILLSVPADEQMPDRWERTDSTGLVHVCQVATSAGQKSAGVSAPERVADLSAEILDSALQPLHGVCITHKTPGSWWAYRVCLGEEVRQFHEEKDGSVTMDWSLGSKVAPRSAPSPSSSPSHFHSHFFEGGQPCDETKRPRATELRFFCCDDADESDGDSEGGHPLVEISMIEEMRLCTYMIHACTPLMCRAGLLPPPADDLEVSLASLNGLCFQRKEGWWSYEFCIGKHVRQFHVEDSRGENGERFQKVTSDLVLGRHIDSSLWQGTPAMLEGFVRDQTGKHLLDKNPMEPSLVQFYGEGTVCDLTNQPRRVTVRFVCAEPYEDRANEILSVQESQACAYSLRFHSPHLCRNAHFQTQPRTDELRVECQQDDSEQ